MSDSQRFMCVHSHTAVCSGSSTASASSSGSQDRTQERGEMYSPTLRPGFSGVFPVGPGLGSPALSARSFGSPALPGSRACSPGDFGLGGPPPLHGVGRCSPALPPSHRSSSSSSPSLGHHHSSVNTESSWNDFNLAHAVAAQAACPLSPTLAQRSRSHSAQLQLAAQAATRSPHLAPHHLTLLANHSTMVAGVYSPKHETLAIVPPATPPPLPFESEYGVPSSSQRIPVAPFPFQHSSPLLALRAPTPSKNITSPLSFHSFGPSPPPSHSRSGSTRQPNVPPSCGLISPTPFQSYIYHRPSPGLGQNDPTTGAPLTPRSNARRLHHEQLAAAESATTSAAASAAPSPSNAARVAAAASSTSASSGHHSPSPVVHHQWPTAGDRAYQSSSAAEALDDRHKRATRPLRRAREGSLSETKPQGEEKHYVHDHHLPQHDEPTRAARMSICSSAPSSRGSITRMVSSSDVGMSAPSSPDLTPRAPDEAMTEHDQPPEHGPSQARTFSAPATIRRLPAASTVATSTEDSPRTPISPRQLESLLATFKHGAREDERLRSNRLAQAAAADATLIAVQRRMSLLSRSSSRSRTAIGSALGSERSDVASPTPHLDSPALLHNATSDHRSEIEPRKMPAPAAAAPTRLRQDSTAVAAKARSIDAVTAEWSTPVGRSVPVYAEEKVAMTKTMVIEPGKKAALAGPWLDQLDILPSTSATLAGQFIEPTSTISTANATPSRSHVLAEARLRIDVTQAQQKLDQLDELLKRQEEADQVAPLESVPSTPSFMLSPPSPPSSGGSGPSSFSATTPIHALVIPEFVVATPGSTAPPTRSHSRTHSRTTSRTLMPWLPTPPSSGLPSGFSSMSTSAYPSPRFEPMPLPSLPSSAAPSPRPFMPSLPSLPPSARQFDLLPPAPQSAPPSARQLYPLPPPPMLSPQVSVGDPMMPPPLLPSRPPSVDPGVVHPHFLLPRNVEEVEAVASEVEADSSVEAVSRALLGLLANDQNASAASQARVAQAALDTAERKRRRDDKLAQLQFAIARSHADEAAIGISLQSSHAEATEAEGARARDLIDQHTTRAAETQQRSDDRLQRGEFLRDMQGRRGGADFPVTDASIVLPHAEDGEAILDSEKSYLAALDAARAAEAALVSAESAHRSKLRTHLNAQMAEYARLEAGGESNDATARLVAPMTPVRSVSSYSSHFSSPAHHRKQSSGAPLFVHTNDDDYYPSTNSREPGLDDLDFMSIPLSAGVVTAAAEARLAAIAALDEASFASPFTA